jgi:hypothetical protein
MSASVNARLLEAQARNEALLVFIIAVKQAYKLRTGEELNPDAPIEEQDEISARRMFACAGKVQ